MRHFYLIFLLFSTTLMANSYYHTPLVFGGVAATAGLGTQAAIYHSLMQTELKGWSRPETGSSIRLESACGIEAEFHLVGDHRRNYLLLGITNSSAKNVVIKNNAVTFRLDKTKERYPGFTYNSSDNRVISGWWSINLIPFPSKEEFRDVKEIEVQVPVIDEASGEQCSLTTHFNKTKKIEAENISYSAFEFSLDGGGAIEQFGNIRRLGRPRGMAAFEFNFFPRPQSGFGLVFSNEAGFQDSDKKNIHKKFDGAESYSANISYLGFQYVYRHFFSSEFFLQYAIGPGYQSVEDGKEEDLGRIESRGLAFSQKLVMNWRFFQWYAPSGETIDIFTGLGLVHFYTPSMKIGGEHLDGHRVGGLLRVGVSF